MSEKRLIDIDELMYIAFKAESSHDVTEYFNALPEPTYVPFTADDWGEFSTRVIQDKVKREEYLVVFWNDCVCMLQGKLCAAQTITVTYRELRDKYVFRCTDIPVGKEVKE